LSIGANIVEEAAKEAVRNGELVMVLGIGSWGPVPYRAMLPTRQVSGGSLRRPWGLRYGIRIPSLRLMPKANTRNGHGCLLNMWNPAGGRENIDMISGYCPARRNLKVMLRENEYFGNQHIQPLIEDLAEEMVQYRQTPLDDRALQIFNEEIFRAIENNVDSQKTIKILQIKWNMS